MDDSKISHLRGYCYLLFLLPILLFKAHVPASYSIISLCFLFIAALYFKDRKFWMIAFSKPMLIWLALTFYHVINAWLKHVPDVDAVDLLHGLKIYACIVLFTYWATKNLLQTVQILVIVFIIRNSLCLADFLIFGGIKGGSRMTTTLGHSTFLGQFAALTGIFILFLNMLKKVKLQKNIVLFLTPFVVVVLTQTRNCLAMLCFSVFAIYVFKQKKAGIPIAASSFLGIVVGIVFIFASMNFLGETSFYQRIVAKQSQNEESYFAQNYSTGTFFDKIVGDRLVYYVRGWGYFKTSPWTGIGMWRYESLSGGKFPLHSEYMVHLCEGGIIAVVLWALFLFLVVKGIINYRGDKYIRYSALSGVAITLFCAIYAREFFYEMFYPMYGLALSLRYRN